MGGSQDIGVVYYNVRRGSVEIVYYNEFARSGSDSDESDFQSFSFKKNPDQQGGAEAAPSEETEYHQYDDVAARGGAEGAGRGRRPPVYEVDL